MSWMGDAVGTQWRHAFGDLGGLFFVHADLNHSPTTVFGNHTTLFTLMRLKFSATMRATYVRPNARMIATPSSDCQLA